MKHLTPPSHLSKVNFTKSTFLLWLLKLQRVSTQRPNRHREPPRGEGLLPLSRPQSQQIPAVVRRWSRPPFRRRLSHRRHILIPIYPAVRRAASPSSHKCLMRPCSSRGANFQSRRSRWRKMIRVHSLNPSISV